MKSRVELGGDIARRPRLQDEKHPPSHCIYFTVRRHLKLPHCRVNLTDSRAKCRAETEMKDDKASGE